MIAPRLVGAAIVLCMAIGTSARAQEASARCAALARLQVPGLALEISNAAAVAAGPAPQGRGRGAAVTLPAHCRVDGTIDRRTGADGKSYGIGFAVTMPDVQIKQIRSLITVVDGRIVHDAGVA